MSFFFTGDMTTDFQSSDETPSKSKLQHEEVTGDEEEDER